MIKYKSFIYGVLSWLDEIMTSAGRGLAFGVGFWLALGILSSFVKG